ncbi:MULTISPECIES: CotY/CotZ family spore coat protein [Bacillaceae]|uniref:Spore coat protein n=1 Tax=Oceanobacillus caeni TaxID=405946 RepID=A0ABR5MIP8_9BACI|nr:MULTISPECIES: CotY/CotZ family spore coat protein [Bacillaceae]KPH74393.1 spore coat protein [Oceanobacillus caeni]MED4475116.1 CotY/CotZ family spore coat protein [Oceanobacillus caeni]
MGCGKNNVEAGNCVADILRDIVEAQNDIVENCCETGCEQSINDLLGETDNGNGLDTVPIILYCTDCKPFKGFGAEKKNRHGRIGDIVASFIFRVKSVDDNNCAVLELLLSDGQGCGHDSLKDPTDQVTKKLEATGICITVDLDCFCHVTCLPAISVFNND